MRARECSSVLIVATLLVATAQAANYCSGSQYLTEHAGNISDHTPWGLQYLSMSSCWWFIQPTNMTEGHITLVFDNFDTEYSYDYVYVYDGPSSASPTLAALSGDYDLALGSNPHARKGVFTSTGPALTVYFYTDLYVTDLGFSAHYHVSPCAHTCSGHGTCTHEGVCECDTGFSGPTCNYSSHAECPNHCSFPYGQCVTDETNQPLHSNSSTGTNSTTSSSSYANATSSGSEGSVVTTHTCVCQPGFHGTDCSSTACPAETTLTARKGVFADRALSFQKKAGSGTCVYVLHPLPDAGEGALTIQLEFPTFMAGTGTVEVYDGYVDGGSVVGVFAGDTRPPTVFAYSGVMSVKFTNLQRSVTARYESYSCESECNTAGWCTHKSCVCEAGRTGTTCSSSECSANCNNGVGGSACLNNDTCTCGPGLEGGDCGVCANTSAVLLSQQHLCDVCAESGVFTASSGILTSSGGNYPVDTSCMFDVVPNPAASSVRVQFDELHLGPNTFLYIYGVGSGGTVTLGEYAMGSTTPGPLIIPYSSARLSFITVATSNNNYRGFVARYTALRCESGCSGNGECVGDDVCSCFDGWSGPSCSVSVCHNNCSASVGGGVCSENAPLTCACEPGFFGVDCSILFCHGTTTYTGLYGEVTDHSGPGTYLPHSDCFFHIRSSGFGPITLVWEEFQIGAPSDTILFSAYRPDGSSYIVYQTTSQLEPLPLVFNSSMVDVRFTTNGATEYEGFRFRWFDHSTCGTDCPLDAYCIDGVCHCTGPYKGANCSVPVAMTTLTFEPDSSSLASVTTTTPVAEYESVFIKIDLVAPLATELVLRMQSHRIEADTYTLVGFGYVPSMSAYDYRNTGFGTDVSISFYGREPGEMYIKLYGFSDAPWVTISLEGRDADGATTDPHTGGSWSSTTDGKLGKNANFPSEFDPTLQSFDVLLLSMSAAVGMMLMAILFAYLISNSSRERRRERARARAQRRAREQRQLEAILLMTAEEAGVELDEAQLRDELGGMSDSSGSGDVELEEANTDDLSNGESSTSDDVATRGANGRRSVRVRSEVVRDDGTREVRIVERFYE